jgi:hypothetical protein
MKKTFKEKVDDFVDKYPKLSFVIVFTIAVILFSFLNKIGALER